jgi:hypothetical protein
MTSSQGHTNTSCARVQKRQALATRSRIEAFERALTLQRCWPPPMSHAGLRNVSYGASRTRTGDLLGAIQALSQLSYSPAAHSVAAGPGDLCGR